MMNLQHMMVIEFEDESGYRYWTRPLPESEVSDRIIKEAEIGYGFSDLDCSIECWCVSDPSGKVNA